MAKITTERRTLTPSRKCPFLADDDPGLIPVSPTSHTKLSLNTNKTLILTQYTMQTPSAKCLVARDRPTQLVQTKRATTRQHSSTAPSGIVAQTLGYTSAESGHTRRYFVPPTVAPSDLPL